MTQTCEITKAQKRLLKIVNCVFQQYVVCKTPASQAFFIAPSSSLYDNMYNELTAIKATINNLAVIQAIQDLDLVRIVAYTADGSLAYDSNSPANSTWAIFNTYGAINVSVRFTATSSNGQVTTATGIFKQNANYAVRKPTQVLNTNESAMLAFQIKPSATSNSTWDNEVSVTERLGCNGPVNTGFLRLSIEVSQTTYPIIVNNCAGNCLDDSSSYY